MGKKEKEALGQKVKTNVILLFCFLAMMLVCIGLMRNQLMKNATESGRLLIDNYSDDEENIVNTYENILGLATRFIGIREQTGDNEEQIRDGLFSYIEALYDLYAGDSIRVVAIVNGSVLAENEAYEAWIKEAGYRDLDWYQGALAAAGEVYLTDAYEDPVTGKTIVSMSQMVYGSDSVVVFHLYFDEYHTDKDALELPENGNYYLCDANGTLLYYHSGNFSSDEEAQAFVSKIAAEATTPGELGFVDDYIDTKGLKRTGYVYQMPNGWKIILTIPHANAVAGLKTMYVVMILMGLFGVVLIAYLAWRDYRREKNNQILWRENHRMERINQMYLQAMKSSMLSYRAVAYVDLQKDTYQVVYPEEHNSKGGDYGKAVQILMENGAIASENREELAAFLEPARLRDALADRDYIEMRARGKINEETYENCLLTFTVVERQEGRPVSAALAIRSIEETLRKEEEQRQLLELAASEAEAANRAKSDFLSNMSHDIRTPMNAIMGMTAIAAMHIDDKERVMDALNKITVSGKHLLGLINSVLDMSKIESGKITLSEEEFKIPDVIDSLVTLFIGQMEAKNLDFKVNIASLAHEKVIGDEQRLSQIFVNIVGNSLKFTPEGGSVSLSIKELHSDMQEYGCFEFTFEDTGIGMEQEFVERIFEPFSRAKDKRINKIEGTGLGMSIAVSIARMMGGDIKVESEVGKGSRFTVTVYLKYCDATEEDLHKLADLPVLVVDDEEDICISTCDILNSLAMKAEYVTEGNEAVTRVEQAHEERDDFSVVLLDWKMPGMDGLATTKAIRQSVGGDVPIIILSAFDWSDIEQEATEAGVTAFIEKPLFRSRLTYVLKSVLGVGQAEKEPRNEEGIASFTAHDYKGKRVLLVEDNELNVEIAGELLHVVGLEVETASNGRQAVEKVSGHSEGYYDLIFMDIQMPIMNGYEATRAIRGIDRADLKEIPIIAMTADAFAEDVKKAMEAGMNGHIAKPIDIKKLETIIAEWLV